MSQPVGSQGDVCVKIPARSGNLSSDDVSENRHKSDRPLVNCGFHAGSREVRIVLGEPIRARYEPSGWI